jgi:hypothetical protein
MFLRFIKLLPLRLHGSSSASLQVIATSFGEWQKCRLDTSAFSAGQMFARNLFSIEFPRSTDFPCEPASLVTDSVVRREYLAALREADKGSFERLLRFVRS